MKHLIITPEATEDKTKDLEFILQQFLTEFNTEEKNLQYYNLIIKGEYPSEVLDEVERLYKEAGWAKVICKTSSNERGGLTGLQLWKKL